MPDQGYATAVQRQCGSCGANVEVRPSQAAKYPTSYCNKSCAQRARFAAHRDTYLRVYPYKLSLTYWRGRWCDCCQLLMWSRGSARYCSQRCRTLAGNCKAEGIDPSAPLTCAECGTTWLRAHRPGRSRFCSDTCQRRYRRRVRKKRHRDRVKPGAAYEPVSLVRVAERDGWQCHICQRKVTRHNWSLDHLVPLSYGGDHTYANVALAHHRCNTLRRDTGAAQLLIFG